MSSAQTVSPLVLSFVAGGFTTLGVLLTIGYNSLAARKAAKTAGLERFSNERREAYEKFYELVQRQLAADRALRALVEAHHKQGKTDITEEEKATVPPSAMGELIATLAQVRRLARTYSVIVSAEAIVQLFVDMTKAGRAALEDPGPDDDLTWFLLQRFLEERVNEFVHGYREDLGLGPPDGAPKKWPIVQRGPSFNLARSEAILREHIPIKIMPKPEIEQPKPDQAR